MKFGKIYQVSIENKMKINELLDEDCIILQTQGIPMKGAVLCSF